MGRIFSLIFVLSLLFGVAACASESSLSEELPADSEGESCKSAIPQLSDSRWEREETLRITVKGSVFEAKLYKNETAQAFASLLPLTLEMSAMPHEKYAYPSLPPAVVGKERGENTGRRSHALGKRLPRPLLRILFHFVQLYARRADCRLRGTCGSLGKRRRDDCFRA